MKKMADKSFKLSFREARRLIYKKLMDLSPEQVSNYCHDLVEEVIKQIREEIK